jgi:hypothetical protein
VAVVLTLVQTKQIRINIHKQKNTKHSTNKTNHSIHQYTYYHNTHTIVKTPTRYTQPHITKQVKTTTVQDTHQMKFGFIFSNYKTLPKCVRAANLN